MGYVNLFNGIGKPGVDAWTVGTSRREENMSKRLSSACILTAILFAVSLVVSTGGTALAGAASFPKMEIKAGHQGAPTMSYTFGVAKFAELVKERTGGAVNVQVFPGAQLGSEKDVTAQVKNNIIQVAIVTPGLLATYAGWGPLGILSMPYVIKGTTDEEQAPILTKLTRGPIMQDVNENAAKSSGIRALDLSWWYGTRNLTTKTKQVQKPADMKGLKIRTVEGPINTVAMRALGASVTPMAMGELYTALQMGVVEGQENPLNTIYAQKFYEVQKYVTMTGHMTQHLVLCVSETFFQGLSPELKALLIKAAQDAGDFQSDMQLKANNQAMQDLKAKGMTVAPVNKAEFAEVTKNAWKEFEGQFGKGVYEQIVNAQ
jgi:TRAP-type transport system periplasmic protein